MIDEFRSPFKFNAARTARSKSRGSKHRVSHAWTEEMS
jgi:hypothetical protein